MRALLWTAITCALGCASSQAPGPQAASASNLKRLDGSRFVWVDAECSDGELLLGALGYESVLGLQVTEAGLLITQDVELATQGCGVLSVWQAEPGDEGVRFRFRPQAEVLMPPASACGASQVAATEGNLSLAGDSLEMVVHASAWCRGFDARFVYRRVEPLPLTTRQVVSRYVAHWNRRDARALSELFAANGSLVEPFTRTHDGNFKRHEGRAAVEAWYRSAFDSTDWLALRLVGLETGAEQGSAVASWEYMDDRLARPLHGRNLFVIGAGEIYETELQLIDEPEAKPPEAAALESTP